MVSREAVDEYTCAKPRNDKFFFHVETSFTVYCLDRKSGKILWQRAAVNGRSPRGSGATA
jgi:hypothetical protein